MLHMAANARRVRWGSVSPGFFNREELNALHSERLAGEPEGEREHFYVCKACGQAVDKRRLTTCSTMTKLGTSRSR